MEMLCYKECFGTMGLYFHDQLKKVNSSGFQHYTESHRLVIKPNLEVIELKSVFARREKGDK